MAMELDLIPRGTRLTSNGEGEAFDITKSPTRTFLCSMLIEDQIEQESIDISIWGSPAADDAAALLSWRDAPGFRCFPKARNSLHSR
jgi:hypothetical protein